jgi:hypothetical protein
LTAVETTTASAPATFSAAWPMDHLDALAFEAARRRAGGEIGTADRVAEVRQHFGDAAHAEPPTPTKWMF